MGIQAHFLQDKNQEKFYPYAHADATFDRNGNKIGDILDNINTSISNMEESVEQNTPVQSDWNISDTSSKAYIKNKPTSLPASDVSAWAKASIKPSYTWEEINNKPSAYTPSAHNHDNATTSSDGFMSSEDKTKLNGIESGANKTTVDSSLNSTSSNPIQNKVVNSALSGKVPTSRTINGKALSANITLSASDVGAIPTSQKGASGGIAELDSSGKVPASQLPSYVDDVLERDSQSEFPEDGETGKIYIAKDTNKTYRWTGSTYAEISASIALGETSSTAYRGDRGKIAYDHSQSAHAPSNAEANVQSDWSVSDTNSDAYIKNKPTSLPANGGNADTVGGHTVGVNVPVNAKFTDTTYSVATDSSSGLMSSDDKEKLDGIEAGANKYVHPSYTSKSSGLYKVTVDSTGHVSATTAVTKSDITALGIPGSDTNTWTALKGATTEAAGTAGYAPAPSAGSANRYLRSDGTWAVPPDTNTTYSNMTAATASSAGKSGLVPAPAAGSQSKYLRGDGTWQTPPNTTYGNATTSTSGLMSAADKSKLDGIASGANNYSLPTASSTTLGGVKTTSDVTSTSGLTPCPIISGVPYYKDTNTTYSLSSFGITATAAELNKLDGVTATATELNYVDGVTSNIQTQLNGKASSSHNHTASSITDLEETVEELFPAIPTSLPNPQSLTISLNGTSQGAYNGSSAKSINITPSSIGAAATSHGTHVTYSTTAPSAPGTASAGSASTVARSDHVHPLQTTVSGNAGSATKLGTARNINGMSFDGSANRINYGTCSTAAATAAKTVSCTGFSLVTGAEITVKFTVTNTASNPTLNVNSTGAKSIYYRGSAISAGYLAANRTYTFRYNGTQYELVGDINTDTNTTYSTGTPSSSGLTKLYTSTGSATDGTMTQNAITNALAGKASSDHDHSASDITSGTLPITRGGTGATTAANARTALGITPANIGAATSGHGHSAFTGATSSGSGTAGYVPAPSTTGCYLCSDGTWAEAASDDEILDILS